ncbi:tailspike protein [Klebsiella phage BUCT_49532]|uniref:Tailspike protein n=1 Tax=Klebsiella phage BUCT_49532 TaxID=2849971 RepID=A0A9E6MUH8_9CAUD|nr:tail spike protein [Klebsiella phage BUCT_49532]QWY14554.1 tailspike protein [Klebsiella phage BUCT_49532]
MTIIKRADLGRPLTWDELDDNFQQVDDLTAAASAAVSSASASATAAASSATASATSATDAANSAANAAEAIVSAVKSTVTFTTGGTLNSNLDRISDGTYLYYWTGAYPVTVPAGSTVAGTGGIAAGFWAVDNDQILRNDLIDTAGAGLSGYDITNTYSASTVGDKLNLLLSPWDYGAVADGTVHSLSEYYGDLAAAQVVYPFVTSLTQSIDYAAIQKCVNEMVTRGAAGMTFGGRGQFAVNEIVKINKAASVNAANKVIDFSGAEILSFGGNIILNDTSFTGWTLANGVTLSGSTLVFAGTTSAEATASITLTGLTIGKTYAMSLTTESYTSTGYLRMRIDGVAKSNASEYGPGVRYAQFTATATSHVLSLVDDTYTTTPVACTISEVDVRECFYPIWAYQSGSSLTHGSLIMRNLRIVNSNSAGFGGIRAEDLNHSVWEGIVGVDGFYGPAMHMLNMTIWSENNTISKLKVANCREAIRFNRVTNGATTSGLNSFARTHINQIIISGCRYAAVFGVATAVYDSVIGNVSGNITSNFRAIFSVHGDQSNTYAQSIRVESNSAPATSGIFEYGRNDLRRLAVGSVGSYAAVARLATGSLSAGTVSNENELTDKDFRPGVPKFNVITFLESSGQLGTSLTYSAGTYMWSEILLNCTPGTVYGLGTSKGLNIGHGIVDIDAALRLADGSTYQGTKFSTKLLKGTVATSDASKVVGFTYTHAVNSETLAATWPASGVPSLTLTASVNRSIQVFAKWTQ